MTVLHSRPNTAPPGVSIAGPGSNRPVPPKAVGAASGWVEAKAADLG